MNLMRSGDHSGKAMKAFLVILALACLALPAFGKTHVIWVLGTEPLFRATQSRAEFIQVMHQYPEREKLALQMLGIDRAAFEQGMAKAPNITTRGLFHLDAMAFYSDRVKVVHDVDVIAGTRMWVVRLHGKTVYVPQKCGNISTVPVAAVESFATTAPQAAPVRAAQPGTAPTVPPVPASPAAVVQGAPGAGPVAVAAAHHAKFPWWIFLVPGILIHGGGGNSSSPPPVIHSMPPSPTPSGSVSPHPSPSASIPASPTPTPSERPSATPTPSERPSATPTPSERPTPTPTPSCGCPSPTPKPTATPCPTPTKTPHH